MARQYYKPEKALALKLLPADAFSGTQQPRPQLHMDYGLKGPHIDANPFDDLDDRYDRGGFVSQWGSSDALEDTLDNTGVVAIADCSDYNFSHAESGDLLDGDYVQNLNIFKQFTGVFGRVYCDEADSAAIPGYLELQHASDGEFARK